jgi:hypothetical protein
LIWYNEGMKALRYALATIAVLLFTGGGAASALGQYVKGTTGVDISYPNCSASVSKVSFGIVGVTAGTAYTQNACLTSQAAHFNNLSLYMNTGWPGVTSVYNNNQSPKVCATGDLNCLAYNYGYNSGQYAVNYANNAGAHSQTWWLDVETMNSWSSDANQNRNSIQGSADALKANGINTVGVYSTTAQWNGISGNWVNNWPSWGATTWRSAKQASTYCTGHQFTGGPSYLMQYIGKSLDEDVAC